MLCPVHPGAGQQLDLGTAPAHWVMPLGPPVQQGSCLPASGSVQQQLPVAPLGWHAPCSPSSPLCSPESCHGGFASAPHHCPGKRPVPGGGSQAPGGVSAACHLPSAPLSPDVLWAHRGPCQVSCGVDGPPLPPAAWCHRCLPRRDSITALPTSQCPCRQAHSGQLLLGSVGRGPSLAPTLTPTAAGTQRWIAEPQYCPRGSGSADRVWCLEHPAALQPSLGGLGMGEAGKSCQHHQGACCAPAQPAATCSNQPQGPVATGKAGHRTLAPFMHRNTQRSPRQPWSTRNQTSAQGHPGTPQPCSPAAPSQQRFIFHHLWQQQARRELPGPPAPINMHLAGFMETDGVGGCAAVEEKAEWGWAGAL